MKSLYIKYREIINYLIVGVLTTVIGLIVYYGCVSTFLDPKSALQLQLANIIQWIVAVTFAYFASRTFVFRSTNKNIAGEAAAFYTARLGTLGMDMLMMFVGVTILHFNDRLVKLVAQAVVIVANYVFSKLFVFKEK